MTWSTIPARVLIADPPWKFGDGLKMKPGAPVRGASALYATMSTKDIATLNVDGILAEDAIVGLWVPEALLQDGFQVLAGWGLIYKQRWTWVKTTQGNGLAFGLGHFGRNCTESLLLAVKGHPKQFVAGKSERTVVFAHDLGHSQKPEELQDSWDCMVPEGHRIELFARRVRAGWECTGDQCPGNEEKIETWLPTRKA